MLLELLCIHIYLEQYILSNSFGGHIGPCWTQMTVGLCFVVLSRPVSYQKKVFLVQSQGTAPKK